MRSHVSSASTSTTVSFAKMTSGSEACKKSSLFLSSEFSDILRKNIDSDRYCKYVTNDIENNRRYTISHPRKVEMTTHIIKRGYKERFTITKERDKILYHYFKQRQKYRCPEIHLQRRRRPGHRWQFQEDECYDKLWTWKVEISMKLEMITRSSWRKTNHLWKGIERVILTFDSFKKDFSNTF